MLSVRGSRLSINNVTPVSNSSRSGILVVDPSSPDQRPLNLMTKAANLLLGGGREVMESQGGWRWGAAGCNRFLKLR